MKTRHYPKFLRTLPETFGLGFHELIFIVTILILSAVLGINPILNIVFILVGITGIKFMKKHFDFVGWLLPRVKQIFISDSPGVEK